MTDIKKFGICDYDECPYLIDKKEFWDDGYCSYHPEKCFIDEKRDVKDVKSKEQTQTHP